MNKVKNIFAVIFITLVLSSCFGGENKEVSDAKKELGIVSTETKSEDVQKEEPQIKEEKKKFEIRAITDEQFLHFTDLSEKDFLSGEVEISGTTLGKVDSIRVNYSNSSSDYPDDSFELKQFKPGDTTFLYRAFSRYETIDFGENSYIFIANSGEKTSKTELILRVEKDQDEEKKELKTAVDEGEELQDIEATDLPDTADAGHPVQIGENKMTYSDIKGLEITKISDADITCENVTDYLGDKLNTWFYWNTCRPIEKDKGLSYFVVRLDGEEYVYEKHYVIFSDATYGVYELERGEGVTKDSIAEKNTELKETNEEYSLLEIVDNLFKKLTQE